MFHESWQLSNWEGISILKLFHESWKFHNWKFSPCHQKGIFALLLLYTLPLRSHLLKIIYSIIRYISWNLFCLTYFVKHIPRNIFHEAYFSKTVSINIWSKSSFKPESTSTDLCTLDYSSTCDQPFSSVVRCRRADPDTALGFRILSKKITKNISQSG